jgi:hypothetical protein
MDEYSGGRMFGYSDETEPEKQPKPEPEQKPVSAAGLLRWLQRGWTKPTVSLRDICVFGPRSIRNKSSATRHVEALAQLGWLVEIKAHRYDRRLWRLPPAGVTTLPD